MKNIPTFEEFINENINEASFTENMNKDTLEIYQNYAKLIDVTSKDSINSHEALRKALDSDESVQKSSQKRLLQQALSWAMTFAIEQER
jgi:hypothetical protein